MIVTLAKGAIISGPLDLRSFQPAFQITIHLDTWAELGIPSTIKRIVFLHSSGPEVLMYRVIFPVTFDMNVCCTMGRKAEPL